MDEYGYVFVADTLNNAIRVVRPDRVVLTIAGLGPTTRGNRDGLCGIATFSQPYGVAVRHQSIGGVDTTVLIVADTGNHRIRWLKLRAFVVLWTSVYRGLYSHVIIKVLSRYYFVFYHVIILCFCNIIIHMRTDVILIECHINYVPSALYAPFSIFPPFIFSLFSHSSASSSSFSSIFFSSL